VRRAIDLFCGAGGTTTGLKRAGIDVTAGIDNSKEEIETYKHNHGESEALESDIREIGGEEISVESPFLIAGSPPCQVFSAAKTHGAEDKEKKEKNLYREMLRIVGDLKPKFVLMENVKGMKKISDQVKRDFDAQGYASTGVVLNARDFGIPQDRERLFFLGIDKHHFDGGSSMALSTLKTNILKRKQNEQKPLKSTFWGLRELEPRKEKLATDKESKKTGFTEDEIVEESRPNDYILNINRGEIPEKVYNHKSRYHNERDRKIYRKLPEGENAEHESIQDIMPYKLGSFKDKYYKLERDSPCRTITAHMDKDCNTYIHPLEHRGLTPREAARVQSFPDDYRFMGSFTQWYRQIGNAVPPVLAENLAQAMLETDKDL
jgi:DNA (cytosine-5)-methyltransferase 1